MLSLFPALLNFSFVAIFLLRIVTGLFFLVHGLRFLHPLQPREEKWFTNKILFTAFGNAKVFTGLFLIAGVYTQAGAIFGVLLGILSYTHAIHTEKSVHEKQLHLLLTALSFSLLFLGPGLFSFDIPL